MRYLHLFYFVALKQMNRLYSFLLITTFVICCNYTSLQAKGYNFRHYKVTNGLSSNTVRAIIQDHQGFMWFGTEDGLNRFDGYSFKIYKSIPNDTTSLGNNYIYSIFEDCDQKLWIGTEEGVYIYNPETEQFSFFNCTTSNGTKITSNVQQILEDGIYVWFGTLGQNIFRYNRQTKLLEYFAPNNKESKNTDYICHLYKDHQNTIWASTSQKQTRLSKFNPVTNQFESFDLALLPNDLSIHHLYEDSRNNFWLGTWEDGICKLNRETGQLEKFLQPQNGKGISHIHSIAEPEPGTLFIGSDDGLACLEIRTGSYEIIAGRNSDEYGLTDKFVYPIYKDKEGGIWIGTYYGGISYISPNNNLFERYVFSEYINSIGGNVIGKFSEDSHGNLWIASDDGGLNYFNTKTNQFTTYKSNGKDNLPYHNVHALCIDNNKLWIGTYAKGLLMMDIPAVKFKTYTSNPEDTLSLDGNSIYSIFKDRESHLWIGSSSGLNQYNYQTDQFIRKKNIQAVTIDILEDMYGYIWFATWGKGLWRFHNQNKDWVNYTYNAKEKSSLPNNQVNCLCVDKRHRLWVGTGNGLCQYDYQSNNFTRIPLDLRSSLICDIIEDGEYLWLTTTSGLVKFNPATHECKAFTQSDGLQSNQFNVKSGIRTANGKIYVGTANGFNAFYPENVVNNPYVPPVIITNLQIFNKDITTRSDDILDHAIEQTREIILSYKQTVFSLEFVALSYATPEKNQYAFKLEGFDKEWNYVGNQRKATYTNLPAGHYTFKVIASNNDGIWNMEGTEISITIKPPIWLSNEFIILYILLFIALVFYSIRYFNKRSKRKHEEELRQLNIEKEKEVYNTKISFFTLVAHEIRTPVSLIIGPLEKIMNEMEIFPDKIKDDLKIIARNSQRLLFLVNQLLDFRKAEQNAVSISFSEQNIYDLLQNVYERFKPFVEQKNAQIFLSADDQHFMATIDPEAITKAVSNLLSNASKYTKDRIDISLQTKNRKDDTFEITISDNGIGIIPEEQEQIFKPFYQIAGNNKPGTGIGLSLVKTLVESHHGEIKLVSVPGEGTSFSIILPVQQEKTKEQQEVLQDHNLSQNQFVQEDTDSGNETVNSTENNDNQPKLLIIEDNQDMREFLHKNFSSHYHVFLANNGLEGLQTLKQNKIDIIVSDLMMPEMDGIAFSKELKKDILLSHVPVILLTAKTDTISKIDAMKSGADDYIEKPFSVQYLEARIENLLESRKKLRKKFSEMPFVPLNSIASNKADEKFLLKMNEIIENHISDTEFSIDQLAEKLGISRSGLFAKIKNLTDITPNELILLIRLKKAAELLAQNKYRINEICYLVGFNSPSYFSKCFQKQFGVLPKDFKS